MKQENEAKNKAKKSVKIHIVITGFAGGQ